MAIRAGRSSQALGYRARAVSALIEARDPAALERALWAPGAPRRAGSGDVQPVEREAHDARFRHRPSRAGTRRCRKRRDPAARGRAVRRESSWTSRPARCASPASARVPKARCSTPKDAAAQLHRAQLRAVRAVREDLPRGRDHARAAARCSTPEATQPRVLNEDRGRSTACAAASRSATSSMIDNMLGRLAGHSMFARARRARPAADVRRLPRDRHDREERRRNDIRRPRSADDARDSRRGA